MQAKISRVINKVTLCITSKSAERKNELRKDTLQFLKKKKNAQISIRKQEIKKALRQESRNNFIYTINRSETIK